MSGNNQGHESPETFFYDLIANPQAANPSDMTPGQAGFVRLTVETEQTAAAEEKTPDFQQLWQQTLRRAEEIQSGFELVGNSLPLPERVEILPAPIKPIKYRPGRFSLPLALVASLVLVVVAGIILFLAIQARMANPNPTSLAGSPSTGTKLPPTATPSPTQQPVFNGLDLPYPGATSLTAPSDLWFRNYPAALVQKPSQFAFAVTDKSDKILSYYRQKLAGNADYTEDRPISDIQPFDGLFVFKGSSLLVINVIDPPQREILRNVADYFKLFRQMSPTQSLLIITYGTTSTMPDLPDLSFNGSTALSNIDIKNWPDIQEPFGNYDMNVAIRPTLTTYATAHNYVQVVNTIKLNLLQAGYETYFEPYGQNKTCVDYCQKNGWDFMVASKDTRTVLVRIYGPGGRDAFQPAEIQKLTAQGLKSTDTLVSYRTGYTTSYTNAPLPLPDISTANLAMAPNASYVAVGKGNEVQLWKDGATLNAILDNFQSAPYKMAWSPDSQTLAIASGTGIQFWSAQTGQLTLYGSGHSARIKTLAWSSDGKTLASAAGCQTDSSNTCDERVLLWQPNGSLIAILPGHKGSPNAVLWSPDGQQLATEQNDAAAGGVRIWDTQGKLQQTLATHPVNADNMAWLPSTNSKILATGPTPGTTNQGVTLWDTTSGQAVKVLPPSGTMDPTHLAWSPDGTILAVTMAKAINLFSYPGGQSLKILSGNSEKINALGWSPDGKMLATAGQDATIRFWDKLGNPINVLFGSDKAYTTISWSPKSDAVLSISSDMNLWYTGGSDIRGNFGSTGGFTLDKIAWFPGSDNFITYGNDGLLTTWNNLGYAISTFFP